MQDNTPAQRQAALVARFQALPDWKERYRQIIALGKDLTPLSEEERDDRHKVRGCQSQVWLHATLEDGRVLLRGDSDATIVRGLVAVVLHVYDRATPSEVLGTPPSFIDELGLSRHLSQARANGLAAMVRQIQLYAMAFERMAALTPDTPAAD